MNNKIAYTPNMLAAIFNRELSVIQLSLSTFEQFGMIIVEDNEVISIANWEKHQNIDGMDKIREQNKLRQRKHREKQLQLTSSNVTSNVTVTEDNAIDKDKEEDKIKSKIKNKTKKQLEQEQFDKDLKEMFIMRNIYEPLKTSILEFIEHRKQIKKPMTILAVGKFLNKLDREATNIDYKIELIEDAIGNGWQTTYPKKAPNKKVINTSFMDVD